MSPDPQSGEGIRFAGGIAAAVGTFFLTAFKIFPTRKEFDTLKAGTSKRCDELRAEQILMTSMWRDDVRGLHEKIDRLLEK